MWFKFGPPFFSGFLPLLVVLNIVPNYHPSQFKGENEKKLILDLILAHLAQIWTPKIFFVSFSSTGF